MAVSKSLTLSQSTIPRATTPVIDPLVMGQEGTITLEPASDDFTHTITYNFGIQYQGTIATKTAERSIKWTPPKSLANVLTSAESGRIPITCTTYNGDTVIGYTVVRVKITVSPDTVPTLSVSLSDAAGYKNIYGWVQNKSRVKASITAAGVMGSKIIDTVMTVNGKVVDADAENSLPNSGTIPVKVVVTDSRKRTKTYIKNLVVSAYTTPVINNLAYVRGSYTNGVWTENSIGADIKITFTLAMALSANRANLTVSLDGVVKQTVTNQSAGAKTLYLSGVGTDTTQKLEIAVSDAFSSKTSKEIIVATVEVPLNINFSLPSVCFGGIAEKEKTVQFKWPVDLNGDMTIVGDLKLNGISIQDISSKLGVDYIVEQGASGIWTYRKWSSGIVECWGAQSYSNIAVDTAWGSVYESAGQKLAFPSGLFTAAPEYCSITYGGGSEATLSIEPYGLPSKTETQTFCLTRAAADTITNAKVQVHAIGRWK